jgi:hypothetical protein
MAARSFPLAAVWLTDRLAQKLGKHEFAVCEVRRAA